MKVERNDVEIREQFQRLKRQDERLARPFSAFVEATRLPAEAGVRRPSYQFAAAVALALALLAGVAVLRWTRTSRPRTPGVVSLAQLSRWRAPTDSLLHAPGSPLLRTVPRFGAPLTANKLAGGDETK